MKDMQVLPYDFYNRDTLEVAPDLLGKYLIRKINGHQLVGKIVEVEAYKGSIDKGAHSYNYRRTPRTEVMFSIGHAYVYLIYGMYYCLNIVAKRRRTLCRFNQGIEPVKVKAYGCFTIWKIPRRNYYRTTQKSYQWSGKVCKPSILLKTEWKAFMGPRFLCCFWDTIEDSQIIRNKRINIDYAEEQKIFFGDIQSKAILMCPGNLKMSRNILNIQNTLNP